MHRTIILTVAAFLVCSVAYAQPNCDNCLFLRGDANGSGVLETADASYITNWLFVAGSPPPDNFDSADTDDDGDVELNDAVYITNYLHLGGPPPPHPFAHGVGLDYTGDALQNDCSPDVNEGQVLADHGVSPSEQTGAVVFEPWTDDDFTTVITGIDLDPYDLNGACGSWQGRTVGNTLEPNGITATVTNGACDNDCDTVSVSCLMFVPQIDLPAGMWMADGINVEVDTRIIADFFTNFPCLSHSCENMLDYMQGGTFAVKYHLKERPPGVAIPDLHIGSLGVTTPDTVRYEYALDPDNSCKVKEFAEFPESQERTGHFSVSEVPALTAPDGCWSRYYINAIHFEIDLTFWSGQSPDAVSVEKMVMEAFVEAVQVSLGAN